MNDNPTTIRELCEAYGISQTELSRKYDIPLRTVQDWHSGRRTPPSYVVNMLLALLHRTPAEKENPLFHFKLGEMIFDVKTERAGAIMSRCQSGGGLITYHIKGLPKVGEPPFWWAPQKHLTRYKND